MAKMPYLPKSKIEDDSFGGIGAGGSGSGFGFSASIGYSGVQGYEGGFEQVAGGGDIYQSLDAAVDAEQRAREEAEKAYKLAAATKMAALAILDPGSLQKPKTVTQAPGTTLEWLDKVAEAAITGSQTDDATGTSGKTASSETWGDPSTEKTNISGTAPPASQGADVDSGPWSPTARDAPPPGEPYVPKGEKEFGTQHVDEPLPPPQLPQPPDMPPPVVFGVPAPHEQDSHSGPPPFSLPGAEGLPWHEPGRKPPEWEHRFAPPSIEKPLLNSVVTALPKLVLGTLGLFFPDSGEPLEQVYDLMRPYPREELLPEEQGMEHLLDVGVGAVAGAGIEEGIVAGAEALGGAGLAARAGATVAVEGPGNLGGRLLSVEELAGVEARLAERGVAVEVGSQRMPRNALGAFDPAPGPAGKPAVLLGPNPTEYEALHELLHVEHWEAVGPEEFARLTRFEKEQYVYQRLRSEGNWARLTETERIHAADYILEVLRESRGGK